MQRKSKTIKQTSMEAALRQDEFLTQERPLIDQHWRSQRTYTREEFMNKLAKRLGEHYGLADIRDAKC